MEGGRSTSLRRMEADGQETDGCEAHAMGRPCVSPRSCRCARADAYACTCRRHLGELRARWRGICIRCASMCGRWGGALKGVCLCMCEGGDKAQSARTATSERDARMHGLPHTAGGPHAAARTLPKSTVCSRQYMYGSWHGHHGHNSHLNWWGYANS